MGAKELTTASAKGERGQRRQIKRMYPTGGKSSQDPNGIEAPTRFHEAISSFSRCRKLVAFISSLWKLGKCVCFFQPKSPMKSVSSREIVLFFNIAGMH